MLEREFFGESFKISVRDLMYRVYAWMSAGLTITAAAAYLVSNNAAMTHALFTNNWIFFGLMIAQLALVVVLSAFLTRLSFVVAAALFLLYSLLMGITLSSLFIIFSLSSLAATFIIVATMFAVMSLYGYFTQADLSTMGNILFMALIGLIIAMVVNIFLKNSAMQMIISGVGVIVFSLLTAYDVQKIKYTAQQLLSEHQDLSKVALFGALTLYLDFINLFLFVLNFTGQRRQE